MGVYMANPKADRPIEHLTIDDEIWPTMSMWDALRVVKTYASADGFPLTDAALRDAVFRAFMEPWPGVTIATPSVTIADLVWEARRLTILGF